MGTSRSKRGETENSIPIAGIVGLGKSEIGAKRRTYTYIGSGVAYHTITRTLGTIPIVNSTLTIDGSAREIRDPKAKYGINSKKSDISIDIVMITSQIKQ